MLPSCGIAGMGFHLPASRLSVPDLARQAGLPPIVADFAGARTVREAGPDESCVSMGVRAGREALEKAGTAAEEVDLVIWCGAAVPDQLMPTSAGVVQHELGCTWARAFDVAQGCSAMLTGLQVGHGQIALDPECRTVLLATADRWSAFTRYHNADSVFFGEGGGAVVLRRGFTELQPLSYHTRTRGDCYGIWMLEAGGANLPASAATVEAGLHTYRCREPERAHGEFKDLYVPTLVDVARVALGKAGLRSDDIAFFSMVNANLRVLELVCEDLGIARERSSAEYLQEYGHFGAQDVFLNLELALGERRIRPGDHVLMLTTGIGFFWVAAVLRC